MRNLLKTLILTTFVLIFFFFYNETSYAQTCGSYSCGTNIRTCVPEGCVEGSPLNPCTSCNDTCQGSVGSFGCNYDSTTVSCQIPRGVNECGGSSNACITSGCPASTCTASTSCGSWSGSCGSVSRTCTTTNSNCTTSTYTDYGTVSCPTGEYCSTNSCYTYRSITVNVIRDYDHNSTTNGGDTGYPEVTVSVGASSATTNAGGAHVFSSLTQGTYNVSVTVPSRWAVSNSGAASTSVSVTTSNATVNFYLTPTYTITAHVGEDLDNTPNSSVNNYQGAAIGLIQGGSQVASCTTNTLGNCSFNNVTSNLYRVRLNLPAGYEGRLPANPYDCNPNSCIGGTYDVTQDMPASPTTADEAVNFVMTRLIDASGTIYRDTNGGTRSKDVVFGGGASVVIKQGGSNVVRPGLTNPVTSGGGGNFSFAKVLRPGTYAVIMDVPPGYSGVPGVNETCLPSLANCNIVSYTETDATLNISHDFVISTIQTCSVTGSVTTTTGTAVPGVQLNLSGGATGTDTSDSAGNFAFGSYQDGTGLTVTLTVPTGYTIANGGAARPAGVCPPSVVNYILNAPTNTFDVGGRVCVSSANDNDCDAGDDTYGGANPSSIELRRQSDNLLIEAKTLANFTFTSKPAGTYKLVMTNVPSGYFVSNNDASCNPVNCEGQATLRDIAIGPDNTGNNFVLRPIPAQPPPPPGCNFVGTVYVDTDFDNQPDRPYGAGTTVNLRHGGTLDDTDTTGQGGKYSLNTTTARTNYRVQLDVPGGYQEVSTNPINNLTCPASLNTTITRDFVIRLPGCTINGNVYVDMNGNGVRDGGEPGISGTTVTIKRGGSIVDTRTTNVAGSYATTQTTGYSYTVTVPQPGDTAVSTPPNPRTVTVCPDATANFGFTPIPKGNLDGATCTNFGGWTCDASDYNTALTVHFYADGPAGGGGTYLGATVANASRGDLGGVCGGVLTHGYNFGAIPASLKDGQNHTIYAYGLDYPASSNNPVLGGSPKTINCEPAGNIISDPITCTIFPDDADGLCGVDIVWSCEGPSCGVCVSTPGSGESAFSVGPSGVNNSASAPWINGTDPYTFTLRSPLNSCAGPIIGTVVVRGTQTYKISGRVYVDANGNGVYDSGDSNYTGANLIVKNSVGTTVSSPTTSGAGVTNYTTYPPAQLAADTYSVTLTIPADYALTTPSTPPAPPNQKSITLGPNGIVNFGIRQSYSIAANALVDNDLNNCTAGATTYNQNPQVAFSLTDTDLGTTNNSGPVNSPYTFINVLPDNQQISMSVPTGFRLSDIAINPGSGTRVGNSLNFTADSNKTVNFCITNAVAWFQVNTGDVRYPTLIDKVPAGKAAGLSGDSVFFSSNSASDFGSGGGTAVGDPDKWLINNEYATQNSAGKNSLGSFSYEFYKDRAAKNGVTVTSLTSVAAASDCVPNGSCVLPVLPTGIYEVTGGNLTITGVDGPQTNHVVLLVDGSVTIKSNITTGGNGLFILAVKTDMTIDRSVGTSANSSAFSLSGFYSAERSIVLDGDGIAGCLSGSGDNRLNVEGALIANALYPFSDSGSGKITNNRSLCASTLNYPTLYVAMKPSFFTQLTDFYKTTNKRWMQVQP